MVYFIKSPYTHKLFYRLKQNHPEIVLIELDSLEKVQPSDRVVLDACHFSTLEAKNFVHENLIVLGEKTEITSQAKTVSKYQSYKQIEALILDVSFPVYFLTQTNQNILSEETLIKISNHLDIDYRISLNYSPSSSFSLFNHIVKEVSHIERHKTINVITCFKDYLNPPVNTLITMIEEMKMKGSVLIYSAPLKGQLDYSIMTSADSVLLLNDRNVPCRDYDFSSVLPTEKLIFINHIDEFTRMTRQSVSG